MVCISFHNRKWIFYPSLYVFAIYTLCIGLYVYWIRPNRKSLEAKLNDLDATLSQMREDGYRNDAASK